ncbi:Transport-associated protein [gamma proteobacterium HdN1]|nr:Transport-associated protein [gamma proteobacterium HdN1]
MASWSGPGVTDEDPGTRTVGMVVEDTNIETKVSGNLLKVDPRFRENPIQVTSYNGIVLLTGRVPDQETSDRAASIAKRMRGVRGVHNMLEVAPPIRWQNETNDNWILSKVKAVLYSTLDFPASRVKVVTENGTVYLMGLVTESEGEDTVNLIRNVKGIQRIVKIFEYIPQRPQSAAAETYPGTI